MGCRPPRHPVLFRSPGLVLERIQMTLSYYVRDAMRFLFITWAALGVGWMSSQLVEKNLLGFIIYVGLAGIVAMVLDRKLPETKA